MGLQLPPSRFPLLFLLEPSCAIIGLIPSLSGYAIILVTDDIRYAENSLGQGQ